MNLLSLSWRYLWSRPLVTALNLLLLTLGLATLALVLTVQDRVQRAFERDLAGIDLVVGAKGSPLQLILSGVFHLDVPTGNIPLAEVQRLAAHEQVAQLIPISLGDSVVGHRIVGTQVDYVAHYGARTAQGRLWAAPMEAVLGAQVAQHTGLRVGQAFVGSHGLGAGGHAHGESPYAVVGVLAPCACVLDRLVLTDLASVWQVHEDLHQGDEPLSAEDRAALAEDREVTLALIRYRSPLAAASFPRLVNASTALQAASPAVEVTRLLTLVGTGTRVMQGLAAVLLGVAGLSVFIALWQALRERQADLALLRLLGAPPRRLTGLLLLEALWLALLGSGLGLFLAHGLTALLGWLWATGDALVPAGWYGTPALLWVPVLALGVALLAAALPVLGAYRLNVHALLTSR